MGNTNVWIPKYNKKLIKKELKAIQKIVDKIKSQDKK